MFNVPQKQFIEGFQLWSLTVTVWEADEATRAGVAVLSSVVGFAEAAAGQILTGTVCELRVTVTACEGTERGRGRRRVDKNEECGFTRDVSVTV